MTTHESLDNILNECIDRLTQGETVEGCLAHYPEQAEQLRPLLLTVKATLVTSVSITPRPEFRAAARHRFLDALAARHTRQRESFLTWPWIRTWGSVAAGIVVLLLIGRGTVAASESALPDQPLYPVKQATEAFQVALAPEGSARAKVYAELADRRMKEMAALARQGDVQNVERLASRLEAHLDNATQSASEVTSRGAAPATPSAPQAAPTPQLTPPPTATPAGQPPAAAAVQATPPAPSATATPPLPAPVPSPTPVEQRPAAAAAEATRPAPTPSPMPRPTATPTPTPDQRGRQRTPTPSPPLQGVQELEAILKRNADQQIAALEKALEEAPPHARPAIEKALERAKKKYAEVIRGLERLEERRRERDEGDRRGRDDRDRRGRGALPGASATRLELSQDESKG